MGIRDDIEQLKTRRRNVRPDELHTLLVQAGFERRFGKGDHWIYSHSRLTSRLTIDPRNPLLPVYVGRAIRAMEEVLDDDDPDGS
jgi:predicted RNA binding protein YcfA (HicA-like mRNA interferase family)